MRNHRLFGPLLAVVGAVGFFVISLMTWYTVDLSKISVGAKFAAQYARQADLATSANGWEPWGYGSDIVMLVVIGASIGLGVMLVVGGGRAVGLAGALLALGVIGTLLVLLHTLSGPEPSEIVDVQPIVWLAALSTLLILAGGYLSFDYAQHSAPRQSAPAPKTSARQPAAKPPRKPSQPRRRPRNDGLWDDADFE